MKLFYKIFLTCTLVLVASCSKEKEVVSEPKVEPVVEIAKPVVEKVEVIEKKPLVYSVQIGAFQNTNADIENANPDARIVSEDGLTKYRLGVFSTYQDASVFKKRNQSKYPDAFVVATNNEVRIDISEALSLSNED